MADQRDYGDENDFHRERSPEEWTRLIQNGAIQRQVGDKWVVITIDSDPPVTFIATDFAIEQLTFDDQYASDPVALPQQFEITGQLVLDQPIPMCQICGGLTVYGEVHVCGGGA